MPELDIAALKEDLKRLRKKPMGFAFGLKDAQTQVLILHKTKAGRALVKDARAQGAKSVTFGSARGEDKVLCLEVEGPALAGLEKKAKLFLRNQKLTLYNKVEVQFVGEAAGAPAGGPATEERRAAVAEVMAAPPLEPKTARHAVSDSQNEALSKLSSEQLAGADLTQRNPKELFTDEYMTGLVGKKMPGANDPNLKDVMRQLEKGVSGARRQEAIERLATILGKKDAKKLDADYGRFLILRDQQIAIQKKKGGEYVPELIESASPIPVHDEFMASNPQLVFGKVVGDAFGIDPVFGALLSPTGGMVGPGNVAVHLDDDDPTGYHGIVHDAAGYLKNYHDQGPGYDYMGKEKHHSEDDPLTGQQSGMRYWHEKLDPGVGTTVMLETIDVAYAVKDVYDGTKTTKELKVAVEKALTEVRDEMGDAFDEALDSAAKKVEEGAKELSAEMEQAAKDLSEAADEAAEAIEETVVENYEDAKESLGEMADEVSNKLESAWNYVWSSDDE